MKITTDNNVFLLPITSNEINILTGNYVEIIVNCLQMYFQNKKKNLCTIYDNEIIIPTADINYLYFSFYNQYDDNVELKQKSLLNQEFSSFILENQNEFKSTDKIREDIHELLTDSGVWKLIKIMNQGYQNIEKMIINNFDIGSILSSLKLSCTSKNYFAISMYNLFLYLNRNKTKIIYLDKFDETISQWLNRIDLHNTFVLVNNKGYHSTKNNLNTNLLFINDSDVLVEKALSNSEINILSYMLKPFILENMQFQKEENIRLYNEFNNEIVTFLIKSTDKEITLNPLK